MESHTDAVSPFLSAEQKRTMREAKRAAVLRAAVQMFNRQGFHQTSLDDVAASIGISKPTIYHYLGNKDQVLLECVVIGLGQLIELAEECRALPGNGADRIATYLARYAEINMDDFGRCVIRTAEEALAPESRARFRELKRRIDSDMRGFIAAGVADGSLAPCDVKLAAFALAGALSWPARWHNPDGELIPLEVAQSLVKMLGNGFLPRESTNSRS